MTTGAAALPRSMPEPAAAGAPEDPRIARYRERETTFRRTADEEDARSGRFSIVRMVLAIALLAALITAGLSPVWRTLALAAAAAAAAAFAVVAIAHDRVAQRAKRHAALAELNHHAGHRVARAWTKLPEPPPIALPPDHPYADDLDLIGHASLVQLIGPPNTPAGRRDLADWLLRANDEPAERLIAGIAARQAAVRELAPQLDRRQQLQAAGLEARHLDAAHLEPLLVWAEAESWLLRRPLIVFAARVLTIATPLLALASYQGWIAQPLWMLSALAGWILTWRLFGPLHETFSTTSGEYTLRPFEQLIATIADWPLESPLLAAARRAITADAGASATGAGTVVNAGAGAMPDAAARAAAGTAADADRVSAQRAIASLRQIVALSDLRHAPLFYLPIHTFFLWDLHVWWLFERWQQRHGRRLRRWLDAIGRIEAITALASLAHDQPAWTYPIVEPARAHGHNRIVTQGLGHPLLRDEVRVTNDVTIGPPADGDAAGGGTFLLITGSNMSGKSTLLRAVGLNTMLAHAGAPVCARSMTLPPVLLHTSMRVSDSLERGLSLFMASLLRLQRVVDAARRADPAQRPLLYLLDEVLQGTNSAERQIAVRTIVKHLVAYGAIGVVTTHDLELASAPDFTAQADSRHLTETVSVVDGELRMTFDYRLRPGPATSGNALALLRMLGLDRP